MKRFPCPKLGLALILLGSWAAFSALRAADEAPRPKAREFLFTYQATVGGLRAGQTARIWLPVPPSNAHQEAGIVQRDLPAEGKIGQEPKFGNRILYLEARADAEGRIPFAVTYRVRRKETHADFQARSGQTDDLGKFLRPDAKVPVGGKPLTLLRGRDLPRDQLQLGRFLYDLVDAHMRYSKEGTGWGQGDAVWACDSGYGNCTDFHSLFMSLARSQGIPARFVIGFALPEKRGHGVIPGYHCWAWFKPRGHEWIPVDISEANQNPQRKNYYFGNLTEDRVAFSTGRDLELVPKQEGPPLNFFIYPYVEVDGKPYPDAKVQRRFTYQDVQAHAR